MKGRLTPGETTMRVISLSARVRLRAAAGEGKPQRFLLIANTGRPMELDEYAYPLVIDCSTATFQKSRTPIIADHDGARRIGHTISQHVLATNRDQVTIDGETYRGPLILAEAVVSSHMGVAQGFVEDARGGFPFECSVGGGSKSVRLIVEGEEVDVNEASYEGPLYVARNTVLRELSVCVLGADSGTSVSLAASALRSLGMSFGKFVASLGLDIKVLSSEQLLQLKAFWKLNRKVTAAEGDGAKDPDADESADDTADDSAGDSAGEAAPPNPPAPATTAAAKPLDIAARQRKQMADEERRVDQIRAVALRLPHDEIEDGGKKFTASEFRVHAIESGMTVDRYELAVRRHSYSSPQRAPAFHTVDRSIEANAMSCAILRAGGVPDRRRNPRNGIEYGLDTMYSEKELEASHGRQYQIGNSIQALYDLQIRAAGDYYASSDRKSLDFQGKTCQAWQKVRAAGGLSTLNIANVLENVMNKGAYAAFMAVESVWQYICGRRPLNDFKPHSMYRLAFDGSFRKVSADGELKHISMSDSKSTVQADAYGAIVAIDYKTMRNDDLGVVVDYGRSLGTLGNIRVEESVHVLHLANAGSFFGTGNKNYISGGTTVLSVSSLQTAREKFRNQTINGKPLMASPSVLLVPTTLETTAYHLFNDERFESVGSTAAINMVDNPFKGLFRPYVSPYINNTDILDQDGNAISGQSDTQWTLLADPSSPYGAAIVIGFLDGRETPYFDEAATDFSIPNGLQMRGYHYWGVALHVHQMGVRSAGA